MPLGTSLPARLPESTGANRYVNSTVGSDGNDGTANNAAHAWATVQYAIDTVTAGMIINVAACTAEKLLVSGKNFASTVTIQGLGSFRPKLHNVWIQDSGATPTRRVRLRHLEFDGSAPAVGGNGYAGYGVSVKPNGGATVELIEFYDVWSHDHGHVLGAGANSVNGFFVGGSAAPASHMTGIHFYNCVAVNQGLEVYAVGNQTSSASLVVNLVDPPGVDGTLYFETNANRDGSPAPALYAYNSAGALQRIHYTGQASGPNRFTGCTGWTGTILDGTPVTDAGRNEDHGWYISHTGNVADPDVLVANCIAYDVRSGYGYQVYPLAKNVWIVNCLSYGNLGRGGYVIGQEVANGTADTRIKNCVAVRGDRDAITAGFHQFGLASGSSPVNRWDSCLSFGNPGGAFDADIAGALASSNKLTGDPLFTNATNPHAVAPPSSGLLLPATRNFRPLAGSPLYNVGEASYTPPFDLDGNARTVASIGPFRAAEETVGAVTGSAAVTGTGVLHAAGTGAWTGRVGYTGAGTMTVAGLHLAPAASALSGAGTLIAFPTVGGAETGEANISGSGRMSAATIQKHGRGKKGRIDVSGSGSISKTGRGR